MLFCISFCMLLLTLVPCKNCAVLFTPHSFLFPCIHLKCIKERLQFFIETLGRALQAEKGALDNMVLILRKNSEDSNISKASSNASQSAVAPLPLAPSSLFTKRKAASTQSEEGSSANEVLALNLPEDLGRWRDIQKRNLSAQYNRTRAIKSFSVFFNGVASAFLSFGSSLAARLANDGYGTKR